MSTFDGVPAFPTTDEKRVGDVASILSSGGMTKREAYAMLAQAGLLAGNPDVQYEAAARQAVKHADALLAELSRAPTDE